MARPADWSPLADTDPVPGDPVEVAALGGRFQATADEIASAVRRLRTMCTDEFWDSGAGASFRILLPRRVGDEVDEPVKTEAVKPSADLTGRGAILLVEDEEAVRAFASRALASRGYTVLEAETGLDALRVAEEATEPIDLIVSDVIMPEMDGPTMLTELRKRGSTAKVVFVSGYADDAFARNLPEGQDFMFLPKPFSLKQLIETVKSLMN